MKIKVDDKEVFELQEWEKKVIQHDIPTEIFEDDMKRRLQYILKHKAVRCFERFQKQWLEILRKDPKVKSIPVSQEEFVMLVVSRSDYKDRTQRDADEKKALENTPK